jgi:hypothetical protein
VDVLQFLGQGTLLRIGEAMLRQARMDRHENTLIQLNPQQPVARLRTHL